MQDQTIHLDPFEENDPTILAEHVEIVDIETDAAGWSTGFAIVPGTVANKLSDDFSAEDSEVRIPVCTGPVTKWYPDMFY